MPEPAPPAILLNTCAAVWLVNGDPMSAQSRAAALASRAGVRSGDRHAGWGADAVRTGWACSDNRMLKAARTAAENYRDFIAAWHTARENTGTVLDGRLR